MSGGGDYEVRLAELADVPALRPLIERSARALCGEDYPIHQVEGALGNALGLDTQLITDGTYFVVETEDKIVACGGWSFRKTLFGGDGRSGRDTEEMDAKTEAAKVRAFFVDPDHARRGLGSLILEKSETAARERGFRRAELMATLTGLKLYEARGWIAGEPIEHPIRPGLHIAFVPMEKDLTDG